jgi:hypothetical protein
MYDKYDSLSNCLSYDIVYLNLDAYQYIYKKDSRVYHRLDPYYID